MKKKLLALVATVVLCFPIFSVLQVNAANYKEGDQIPYNSYSYWYDYSGADRVAVYNKPIYETKFVLDYKDMGLVSQFNKLADVHTSKNANTYLLDSGDSRIVILDGDYRVKTTINAVTDGQQEYNFRGAQGIFVDGQENIYISDTENARVLVCKEDGTLVKVHKLPESRLIPTSFEYRPIKCAVDSRGYLYVLSDGSYYGAILYSPEGDFLGFYGANTVKNTVTEAIAQLWNKLILNDEKRAAMEVKLPYQFTDLYIDSEDFVFTTTGNTTTKHTDVQTGQIRKLSPGGQDVLGSDAVDYGDEGNGIYQQDILGICVSEDEFIYALDSAYGHVFLYDQTNTLLGVFGNGSREGIQDGSFSYATAIALNGEDVLIIDSSMKTLTVFGSTEYGSLLKEAVAITNAGDYVGAKPLWENVLSQDKQNQLAYRGLGKAYYSEGKYDKALEYSKTGCDRETYALAFGLIRNDFIMEHFVWLILGVAFVVMVILLLRKYMSKKQITILTPKMRLALSVLRQPGNAFTEIKVYRQGSYFIALGILVIYYITSVMKVTNGGFCYTVFDASNFNAILVLLRSTGLVLLFTLCFWAVSTLQSGQGRIGEIFITVVYSIQPLIISNVVYIVLTNIMLPEEIGFLSLFMDIMTIYTLFILCMGLMRISDYEIGKFIFVCILTVAGMIIVVFIGIVVLLLLQLLGGFITTVISETYKIMTFGG